MQITLSTTNLVPLIDALSQNLTEIASILKADAETATPAEKTEPQKEATKPASTKSKQSPSKKAEAKVESTAASSGADNPVITIEQVRAVLAEKSQAGLTTQVKDLLQSFGSIKLSGIDPARYGDLIEAAKALQ